MRKWILPTLSELLAQNDPDRAENNVLENDEQQPSRHRMAWHRVKAEGQWTGAIAALEQLLQQLILSHPTLTSEETKAYEGLILAGPSPILSNPTLNTQFQTWIFSFQRHSAREWMHFQLPPAPGQSSCQNSAQNSDCVHSLPLLPTDPLAAEQFCIVLTHHFSLVMALGEDLTSQPAFLFSFDPQIVQQAWGLLRTRMRAMKLYHTSQLDSLVQQFGFKTPDYRTVTQFSRLLLKHLPDEMTSRWEEEPLSSPHSKTPSPHHKDHPLTPSLAPDVELLQAFAHEVRTPLATIRTLTRLLLKRKDLLPDIIKRLEFIDHECNEQIDRMELLFRAAELETSNRQPCSVQLTRMSLDQVFQHSLPRWQKQASRRSQTLDVQLPQQMPSVVSDPKMLDQVLTGLVENFTRSLPSGSHIQMQVIPAGNQLKVQLQHYINADEAFKAESEDNLGKRKSIGQLLMFQPETGNLSLNHSVTKNLFQAMGGKLIVRQRPKQGEVLTIFLPLVIGDW